MTGYRRAYGRSRVPRPYVPRSTVPHRLMSGGFTDAHMSSSDESLAPLLAEEDVAVRRRQRRITLRTGGRRVLVVKDVLPHARRCGLAGGIIP